MRQPKGLANAASIVGIGSAVVSLLVAVVLVRPTVSSATPPAPASLLPDSLIPHPVSRVHCARPSWRFSPLSLARAHNFTTHDVNCDCLASAKVVPHDVEPLIAWVLVYEWSLLGAAIYLPLPLPFIPPLPLASETLACFPQN